VRRYLLDTGPLAALLLGRPGFAALLAPRLDRNETATSMLAYGEVLEYLMGRSDFLARQQSLRTMLREVHPYALTYSVLERYADLRRRIRPPHGSGLIGDIDTLIAATAWEHDLTLVTTDSDFRRVPDLQLEVLPRTLPKS